MMYSYVERADIDAFIEEIWGIRLQDATVTVRRF
jgi:hypothetical protein